MFKIVIIIQTVNFAWSQTYDTNRAYRSLELCETARSDMSEVAEVYLKLLQPQHSEPLMAVSKCVKNGDAASQHGAGNAAII
jgi:hypothetical protein